jgi:hypothetical protein
LLARASVAMLPALQSISRKGSVTDMRLEAECNAFTGDLLFLLHAEIMS